MTDEDKRTETLSGRVEQMFGSAPRSIVKAVARFLEKNLGALDLHHLEVVAAATPVINDPRLVAQIIDKMEVTGIHVATQPIDIDSWREKFQRVLTRYPTVTRQRLVHSLVQDSTMKMLDNVPTKRIPEAAVDLYNRSVKSHLASSSAWLAYAPYSPHLSIDLVDATLDEVAHRVERAETGTTSRPPHKIPIGAVGTAILGVLKSNNEAVSPAHKIRAWQLAERCEITDAWRLSLVDAAKTSPELLGASSEAVAREIDRLDEPHRSERLYQLLCSPHVDERVAREVVASGATPTLGGTGSELLAALRYSIYSAQARTDDLLPRGLSDDEIDKRLVAQAIDQLSEPSVVAQMTARSALQELCRREEEIGLQGFGALVSNPALDLTTAIDAVRRRTARSPIESDPAHSFAEVVDAFGEPGLVIHDDNGRAIYEYNLMLHPKMDVETAATLLREAGPEKLKYMVKGALFNASFHRNTALEPLILDVLKEQLASWMTAQADAVAWGYFVTPNTQLTQLFKHLAASSLDPNVQQELVDIAMSIKNEEIFTSLAGNVTVERSTLSPAVTLFADAKGMTERALFATLEQRLIPEEIGWCRDALSLARDVIGNRADSDVIDVLVEGCLKSYDAELIPLHHYDSAAKVREAFHEAVEELIDHDLLTRDHWSRLADATDGHTKHRYLSHLKCPKDLGVFESFAQRRLNEVISSDDAGLGRWPARDRSVIWADLPSSIDQELPLSTQSSVIDRQTIAGVTLRTPRTKRDLHDVAARMGNCVAGFIQGVTDGTHVVAYGRDDQQSYAAVWTVSDDGKLTLYEVNTTFNTDAVTLELRNEIAQMTNDLNEGRLTPVPDVDREIEEAPPAEVVRAATTGDAKESAQVGHDADTERDAAAQTDQTVELQSDAVNSADEQRPTPRRSQTRASRIVLVSDSQNAAETITPERDAPSVLATTDAEAAVDAGHDKATAPGAVDHQLNTGHSDMTL